MKEFINKLIGRLEEKKNLYAYKRVDYAEGLADAYEQSINIVNQLAEEYNNTLIDTSSGWIACSERLPEDFMGFEYLTVKRNHTGVNISYFCVADHKWYESRNSKREVDVVMWHDIPLPQPYKENENGKI